MHKLVVLVFAESKFLSNGYPANSEGNLKSKELFIFNLYSFFCLAQQQQRKPQLQEHPLH